MKDFRNKAGYICDMDGVIYHGDRLLPGAKEFVEGFIKKIKTFFFSPMPAVRHRKNYSRN